MTNSIDIRYLTYTNDIIVMSFLYRMVTWPLLRLNKTILQFQLQSQTAIFLDYITPHTFESLESSTLFISDFAGISCWQTGNS